MQAVPIPINETSMLGLPLHIAAAGRYELHVASPRQSRFTRACALSAAQYRTHFQCDLQHFYPGYLCLERRGSIIAVCGYRSASRGLFLEQYLESPVENLLTERLNEPLQRQQIVEIGGFAIKHRGLALPFMAALAPVFQQMGFTHAVCTATLPVRSCLRALGISTVQLGKANPDRLRVSVTDWGNYYQHRPVVIAGSIGAALQQIQESTVN